MFIATLTQKDSKRAVRIMQPRGLGHWFACSQRMGETNACLSKTDGQQWKVLWKKGKKTQCRDAKAGRKVLECFNEAQAYLPLYS